MESAKNLQTSQEKKDEKNAILEIWNIWAIKPIQLKTPHYVNQFAETGKNQEFNTEGME